MRTVLWSAPAFLAVTLAAATRLPCRFGPGVAPCNTAANTKAEIQAALDSAAPGDVIEMLPGTYQVNASPLIFKHKPGSDWITIRPTTWKLLPPQGTRISPTDANLVTWQADSGTYPETLIRTEKRFPTVSGGDCMQGASPASISPFRYYVSGNTFLFGASCSAATPCTVRTRNGSIHTYTQPVATLTLTTPPPQTQRINFGILDNGRVKLYYPPTLAFASYFSCANWDGTACETGTLPGPTGFFATNYTGNDTVPLAYAMAGPAGFVQSVFTCYRPWLSGPDVLDETKYGIFWTGLGPGTAYSGPAGGPHHYRLRGIRFLYGQPNNIGQRPLIELGLSDPFLTDWRDRPHHWEFIQCVWEAPPNTIYPPSHLILDADHVLIRDGQFLGQATAGKETQFIAQRQGGPVLLENNRFYGAPTETYLSGGAQPQFAHGLVRDLTIRRNLVERDLDYWFTMNYLQPAPAVVQLRAGTGGGGSGNEPQCSAALDDKRCRVFKNGVEYPLTQDISMTLNASVTGAAQVYVGTDGALYLAHPWAAGDVTCLGLTCRPGVSSGPPAGSTCMLRLQANAGVWSVIGFSVVKNLWEFKQMDNALLEGNVFQHGWIGGQQYQIALTVRGEGGGAPWAKLLTPASRYDYNLHLSPSANIRSYTLGTGNRKVQNTVVADHFTNVNLTGLTLGDNLRIRSGSPLHTECAANCGDGTAASGDQLTSDGLEPGADMDWVETLTAGVAAGADETRRRLGVLVRAGRTSAEISAVSGAEISLQVSPHRNMRTSNRLFDSAAPSDDDGHRKTFRVGGLTPQTQYWYTLRSDGRVVKDFFLTAR